MTWFERLMGFEERDHETVHQNIQIEGEWMTSSITGHSYRWGALEWPSLSELRQRIAPQIEGADEETTLREVVGDVQALHCEEANRDALFQVASQFNLLEMVAPSATPERGVGIYEHDRTQGPACAVAAGAGTIYRNYFVALGEQRGQTAERQIDCLGDMGQALGNVGECLWRMWNGYALASDEGLHTINDHLDHLDESGREALMGTLRIGLQWRTQVTLATSSTEAPTPLLVSQAFCSALPVAYGQPPTDQWEGFGRLVLEASYEACLAAALLNKHQTGCRRVYLTLLGGGVFGNPLSWITDAVRRAVGRYRHAGLDLAVVSYGHSRPEVQSLIREFSLPG